MSQKFCSYIRIAIYCRKQGLVRLRPHPAQLCHMLRAGSHVNFGVTPTMDASMHTLFRWRGGDSQSLD